MLSTNNVLCAATARILSRGVILISLTTRYNRAGGHVTSVLIVFIVRIGEEKAFDVFELGSLP